MYLSTQMHQVTTLAHWLLKMHRCVVYVELDVPEFEPYCHLLSKALQGNSHIKSLKLMFGGPCTREDLAPDILSLSHLEELECTGYLKPTATLVSKLSTFLRTATSLTSLRVSGMALKGPSVEDFFRALGENHTLKELALPDFVIAKASPAARAVFAESLKKSTSLKTLIFAADCKVYTSSLQWILEGLLKNKSVVSVKFKGLTVDPVAVQLISKILAQNKVLRSFTISCKRGYCSDMNRLVQDLPTKADFGCLLKALVKNDTLEQVAVPIEFWNAKQWKALFTALATKKSLKRVTIQAPDWSDSPLPEVCAALRETDADQKVSFKASFIEEDSDDKFTCKAFSEAVVRANDCNCTAVRQFLEQLPSLGHIKSLHLDFDFGSGGDEEMSLALTTFLGATRTLKTLTLGAAWDVALYDFQEAIMKGLTLNTSLREVRIQVDIVKMHFSNFAKPLADAINASKNISRVHFNADGEPHAEHAFLQRLSVGITNNYTLLDVTMAGSVCKKTEGYWFQVWDVMRRNSGLVTAAADFVRGTRRDRHCALALEQVLRHPELVEEVARRDSVDEARAAAMVREGFRSMAGMPDFM